MAESSAADWPRSRAGGTRTRPSRPLAMFRRMAAIFGGVALAGFLVGVAALTVGPRLLPYRVLPVLSGSMRPTFPVGAVLIERPADASSLGVGDAITFHPPARPDALVTHRIVAVVAAPGGRASRTKGDANGAPDPWTIPATGHGWRVVGSVPDLGFVFGRADGAAVRLTVFGPTVLVLGLWALVCVWREPDSSGRAAIRSGTA